MSGEEDASRPTNQCPRCRADVHAREATCPQCGVDLVLAAVLVERLALSVIPAEAGARFLGDAMLSRFGEFLMKKGYITETQLNAALARQREMSTGGVRETLGQVLLEMRVMTREQLELASVEQVQDLQTALRQVNTQLEQRVAERTKELQAAYQRLAELDQLKGNFINNISHELRTPLTKIKGFNMLLAAGDLGALTEDQVQAVQTMGRGISELERLVADLIQFATGARGEMTLRQAPIAVAAILTECVTEATEKAKRRGVEMRLEVSDGLPQAVADGERIRWVLNHLIDNAVKFTPQGGTVTAGAAVAGDRVRVWVADTGEGIAAEKMPELFEAFHQLDGSTTRRQGGTGLGLALVKMIVEGHQSSVAVESEPGKGSRFSFDLAMAAR
ncbi:MAG: ATP-binding protein [Acidobacteria bacterium]|nr:ATP-binding protein [Acidobacteriota bacterium]